LLTKGRDLPCFFYVQGISRCYPAILSKTHGVVNEMDFIGFEWIIQRLELIAQRMEHMHLEAYLRHVQNWRRRLTMDFLSGIVRGIGFSVGFSILGALLIYILRNMALANLPVIGRFLADLVRIVENNL